MRLRNILLSVLVTILVLVAIGHGEEPLGDVARRLRQPTNIQRTVWLDCYLVESDRIECRCSVVKIATDANAKNKGQMSSCLNASDPRTPELRFLSREYQKP